MKHVWVISLESKRYSFESCDMRVICMCIEWSCLFLWGTLKSLQKAIHEVQCFVRDNKSFAYQNDVVTERTCHKWQSHTKQTCYIYVYISHWQVCKTFFLRSPALIIHWEVMCTMWFAKLTEYWQIHMDIFAFTYTYWKLSREKTFTNFTQLTHPPTHSLTPTWPVVVVYHSRTGAV